MSNYFWSLEKAAAEIKKDQVLTASVEEEGERERDEEEERAAFDLSDKARCMYVPCMDNEDTLSLKRSVTALDH